MEDQSEDIFADLLSGLQPTTVSRKSQSEEVPLTLEESRRKALSETDAEQTIRVVRSDSPIGDKLMPPPPPLTKEDVKGVVRETVRELLFQSFGALSNTLRTAFQGINDKVTHLEYIQEEAKAKLDKLQDSRNEDSEKLHQARKEDLSDIKSRLEALESLIRTRTEPIDRLVDKAASIDAEIKLLRNLQEQAEEDKRKENENPKSEETPPPPAPKKPPPKEYSPPKEYVPPPKEYSPPKEYAHTPKEHAPPPMEYSPPKEYPPLRPTEPERPMIAEESHYPPPQKQVNAVGEYPAPPPHAQRPSPPNQTYPVHSQEMSMRYPQPAQSQFKPPPPDQSYGYGQQNPPEYTPPPQQNKPQYPPPMAAQYGILPPPQPRVQPPFSGYPQVSSYQQMQLQPPLPQPQQPPPQPQQPIFGSPAVLQSREDPQRRSESGRTSVPLDQVITDVANMGFDRTKVRSVVTGMIDRGESVDLNVVIDRLTSMGY